MATLTNEVKAFIVQGLATYMTPSDVAEAVKNEFGVEITRQQASSYDPTKAAGMGLAKKWSDMFNKFRDDFSTNIQAIPIANKAYRLTLLNDMALDALKSKNRPLVASLVEQAAKEVGDVYTNKKALDHTTAGKEIKSGLGHFYGRGNNDGDSDT